MGYMGLDSIGDSDDAFDLAHTVISKVVSELRKGLKEKGNAYNTSGPINVALFFEAMIIPVADEYKYNEDIFKLAEETKAGLIKIANKMNKANWGGDIAGKTEHITAINRMLNSMDKFMAAG